MCTFEALDGKLRDLVPMTDTSDVDNPTTGEIPGQAIVWLCHRLRDDDKTQLCFVNTRSPTLGWGTIETLSEPRHRLLVQLLARDVYDLDDSKMEQHILIKVTFALNEPVKTITLRRLNAAYAGSMVTAWTWCRTSIVYDLPAACPGTPVALLPIDAKRQYVAALSNRNAWRARWGEALQRGINILSREFYTSAIADDIKATIWSSTPSALRNPAEPPTPATPVTPMAPRALAFAAVGAAGSSPESPAVLRTPVASPTMAPPPPRIPPSPKTPAVKSKSRVRQRNVHPFPALLAHPLTGLTARSAAAAAAAAMDSDASIESDTL